MSLVTRLIHLGGPVIDYVYRVPGLPQSGADVTATSCSRLPGGAANMMVAARRTGLRSACGGYLGTGPDGDALRAFMAGEGIDALLPPIDGIDSGNSVVLITPDAERSFVSWPGAEAYGTDPSAIRALLRPSDVIAVSGYTLSYPASCEAILALIESLEDDAAVIFDPSPVIGAVPADALVRILARTTWMSANVREISALAGGEGAHAAARRLLSEMMRRAQGIVIRDGAAGAYLLEAGGASAEISGFPVEAVDSNGAGDTHLGAFVGALAHGLGSEQAVRYANAASAISATRHGGATGPTRDEVARFLFEQASGLANNRRNVK
jgi:sugar/nucleoside kinase (ribokinase family)